MSPTIPVLGWELPGYGLALVLALATGTLVAVLEARRRGHDGGVALDAALWVIPAAMIGAHLPYWIAGALERGTDGSMPRGASYLGALAGGGVAIAAFAARRRMGVGEAFDVGAPAAALGNGLGRVGCLLSGCCWGEPTSLPWGITFTDPRCAAPLGVALHPTQAYELLLELGLFAILWRRRLRPHLPGSQALLLGSGYGIGRVFLESFRGDPGRGSVTPWLSATQAAALSLAVACAVTWAVLHRRRAAKAIEPA